MTEHERNKKSQFRFGALCVVAVGVGAAALSHFQPQTSRDAATLEPDPGVMESCLMPKLEGDYAIDKVDVKNGLMTVSVHTSGVGTVAVSALVKDASPLNAPAFMLEAPKLISFRSGDRAAKREAIAAASADLTKTATPVPEERFRPEQRELLTAVQNCKVLALGG